MVAPPAPGLNTVVIASVTVDIALIDLAAAIATIQAIAASREHVMGVEAPAGDAAMRSHPSTDPPTSLLLRMPM
jgi:hypothetical protein